MKEETRIIIKNRLIKSSKDAFNIDDEDEMNKISRMTYILGARKLLLLLSENNVLDLRVTEGLFDDLDLKKVKL